MLHEPQRKMLEKLHEDDAVLNGKKVLIVDDDIRNIFALTSVLERYNMQILSAETGRDAIEILQDTPDIDVVLMDIMMPEMDGLDTMRAIREMPQFKELADHRGDGQGHEGRSREVHRGRGLGLPFQAGQSRANAGGAAGLDPPLTVASADASRRSKIVQNLDMKTSEPVNILVVDDVPEKILAIEATLAELGPEHRQGQFRARGAALSAERRLRRHPARRQHARRWTASKRPR